MSDGSARQDTEGGKVLTVGSLFAGIGGFDLGFERAGFEIKWQVEIEPYATAVLAEHWPHVERFGDVRACGAHNLAAVDVLCGGFPCQPHSLAGARGGAADERDLWPSFARLICELEPRWVVAENVPGLLSSDAGRFFGSVLGDLAACGYDAEWDCLPASAFGAPHRRDRVWLIAYPQCAELRHESGRRGGQSWAGAPIAGDYGAAEYVAYPNGGRELQPQGRERDQRRRTRDGCAPIALAHADGDHGFGWGGDVQMGRIWGTRQTAGNVFGDGAQWRVEPNVGRVAHGIPARVDRLRGLGNAIVPQIAEWIGKRILDAEGDRP